MEKWMDGERNESRGRWKCWKKLIEGKWWTVFVFMHLKNCVLCFYIYVSVNVCDSYTVYTVKMNVVRDVTHFEVAMWPRVATYGQRYILLLEPGPSK